MDVVPFERRLPNFLDDIFRGATSSKVALLNKSLYNKKAKNRRLYLNAHDSRKIIYGVIFHVYLLALIFGYPKTTQYHGILMRFLTEMGFSSM